MRCWNFIKCKSTDHDPVDYKFAEKVEEFLPIRPVRCSECNWYQLGPLDEDPLFTRKRIITVSSIGGVFLLLLIVSLVGGDDEKPVDAEPGEEVAVVDVEDPGKLETEGVTDSDAPAEEVALEEPEVDWWGTNVVLPEGGPSEMVMAQLKRNIARREGTWVEPETKPKKQSRTSLSHVATRRELRKRAEAEKERAAEGKTDDTTKEPAENAEEPKPEETAPPETREEPDPPAETAENLLANFNEDTPRGLSGVSPNIKDALLSLDLKANGPAGINRFFRLSDPDKLVVDLSGKWDIDDNLAKEYAVSHPAITQIRIGEHPTYLRVVFDLKASAADPVIQPRKDGVTIRIGPAPR